MSARSNVLKQTVNYFATAASELRKVVWPTRREVVNHTVVIVVTAVVCIIILGFLDYGLTSLLRLALVGQ